MRANANAPLKVFIIGMPRGGRSYLSLQALRDTWLGFKDAAKLYAVGNPTLIGEMLEPNFVDFETAKYVMTKAKAQGANFIILVLEKQSTTAYSNFKDLADRIIGLHSMCIVFKVDKKTEEPFGDQQWGNLMMKVNLKCGGINHTSPDVSKLMVDTLVLGT